ncbi:MAG TPA: hypothetical protein G4N92_08595 [Anaerolineae bacterium]|nr:hypothetical protein [Anaerolineae bacterium]
MIQKIKIHTDSTGYIDAEIDDNKNPETAKAIIDALPFKSNVRRWGDEVYFDIPIAAGEENSQIEVEVGDLGYWLSGKCFCIFFGRTPASTGEKPAAASPVNVFGKILGVATLFKDTKSSETISVEKA